MDFSYGGYHNRLITLSVFDYNMVKEGKGDYACLFERIPQGEGMNRTHMGSRFPCVVVWSHEQNKRRSIVDEGGADTN